MIETTGLDDERLEPYRWVADPACLAERHLFVAEGRLVVRRLLPLSKTPGHRLEGAVESVLVSPAAAAQLADLVAAHPDVPFYQVPQAVMNEIVGFNFHRGCVAIAKRPAGALLTPSLLARVSSAVALEGVNQYEVRRGPLEGEVRRQCQKVDQRGGAP